MTDQTRRSRSPSPSPLGSEVQVFRGEWDEEGVYFYQAFNDDIADWAIENQQFGGPHFKPFRMTWIKPSFAWMLYRSGYGRKHNQNRILKIKLPHDAVATILSQAACGNGHGGTKSRIQWDPERDIMTSENGEEPRKMLRTRAIQIGVSKELSEFYVQNIMSIEDVTILASRIGEAHKIFVKNPNSDVMNDLVSELPDERPYMPRMDDESLARIALLPGDVANEVAGISKDEKRKNN